MIGGFEAAYMAEADRFIKPFVKMLFFDAMVGCQDRHMKNWGVVRSIKGDHPDHFAPLFDTARGHFWEYSSARLREFSDLQIERYARRSMPPIGGFSGERVTHYELVIQILKRYPQFRTMLQSMVSQERQRAACQAVAEHVGVDFPKGRQNQIRRCLSTRFATLRQIAASNE